MPAAEEPRREQLDGLRALVFFCVFLVHHFTVPLEFLSYALPVFFAMSGFLITRVLWQSQAATLGEKLKVFYVRRILRICPAYYVVLLFLYLFHDLQYPLTNVAYVLNLKIFALSLNPSDPEFINLAAAWNSRDLHLWSMSVEEHYYLLYPLLFFVIPRRRMGLLFGATVALGIGIRAWQMHAQPESYYGLLLPSCMEYFAWGGLFAFLMLEGRLPSRRSSWWALYLPAAAVAVSIAIEYGFKLDGYYMCQTTHFTSFVAPMLGLLIWGLWTESPSHPAIRFMNLKPLVYLGKIGYAMYLVHLSMWDLYRAWFAPTINARVEDPAWQTAWFFAVTFAMTVVLGAALWHFVEVPAGKLKKYFPVAGVPRAAALVPSGG